MPTKGKGRGKDKAGRGKQKGGRGGPPRQPQNLPPPPNVAPPVSPAGPPVPAAPCRWMHAVVAYGEGKHALHVFVFYGFSGAYSNLCLRDSTEELLSSAFEVAHQYRNLPVIFLSDLNLVPPDSDICKHACLNGGWVDAAAALDNLNATHFPTRGAARRLDVVLLNRTAAVSLQQYMVVCLRTCLCGLI